MPNFPEIIAEAFRYTRGHRKLWFFGIFLSWVTMLSLGKSFGVDLTRIEFFRSGPGQAVHLAIHSGYSWYVAFVLVFGAASVLVVTLSRICLINAAVLLHSGEKNLSHKHLLTRSAKQFWPVFAAGIVLNVLLAVLSALLLGPALATLHFGYASRGALLFVAGAVLFLSAWVFLTLLNIFASNFMVVFGLSLRRALPAAVDLFARQWEQSVALVAAVAFIYALVFFMSAGLLAAATALAYGLSFLVKSVAAEVVLIAVVTVLLLLVAAVLAVFSSIVWTIFFLESVGSVKSGEKVRHAASTA